MYTLKQAFEIGSRAGAEVTDASIREIPQLLKAASEQDSISSLVTFGAEMTKYMLKVYLIAARATLRLDVLALYGQILRAPMALKWPLLRSFYEGIDSTGGVDAVLNEITQH